MINEFPKISIITPSFNQGKFIEETILSVINQNYPNLEYIIIDGGSTDNTVEIIKKYESRLHYWVSEKDAGQSAAINKGIQKASGEIIAWLNSDDLYCAYTLHDIANEFLNNKSVDIIYGDVLNFNAEGKEMLVVNQFELYDFFSRVSLHQPSVFWRRALHSEVGVLDEKLFYCMDYALWISLFLNFRSLKIEKVFSRFREHHNAKTQTYSLDLYFEYRKINSRFFNSLPGNFWKKKLNDNQINYDTGEIKFLLKNTYPEKTLNKLYIIYLQNCIDIEIKVGNLKKVNRLFLLNPQLFLHKKSIATFIKTNSLHLLKRKQYNENK